MKDFNWEGDVTWKGKNYWVQAWAEDGLDSLGALAIEVKHFSAWDDDDNQDVEIATSEDFRSELEQLISEEWFDRS